MPQSVNHMYMFVGKGKRLTKTAEQWINTAQYIANREVREQGWKVEHGSVWYVCELKFFFPDKRKRDSHNYLKLLFDALEKIVYDNDYYVKPRIMDVQLDKENPRVECLFYPDKKR